MIPFNARGFKLHKTTTFRFRRESTEQYSTRPLTMVLGSDSPTSTFSTYNVSASGCFPISKILPTLISSLIKLFFKKMNWMTWGVKIFLFYYLESSVTLESAVSGFALVTYVTNAYIKLHE